MTGGMVVPYVWGLLFLDESFSLLRIVGLLVIIVAIVLSNFDVAKSSPKIIALCVAIFFLNGGCSVVSKLCQIPGTYGVVRPTDFVFLTGVTRSLLCTLALLLFRKHPSSESDRAIDFNKALPIIVCSAAVCGVAYLFQLIGASNLPATVLYPIISGGSIIFSTLVGMLCFKEKPNV